VAEERRAFAPDKRTGEGRAVANICVDPTQDVLSIDDRDEVGIVDDGHACGSNPEADGGGTDRVNHGVGREAKGPKANRTLGVAVRRSATGKRSSVSEVARVA
jgi:hypothetical protein